MISRRPASAPACILVALGALLVSLLPGVVLAACPQWDINGTIGLVQTNGVTASVNLKQTDTGIQGSATWGQLVDGGFLNGLDYIHASGSVDGTINGDTVDLTIYWDDQTTGVYTGRINAQGRITGSTYDAQHPQTIANWHSDRTLTCVRVAPSAPAKPAVVLGRAPPTPGAAASAPLSICDRARAAIARNSPSAPALERQCVAGGGH